MDNYYNSQNQNKEQEIDFKKLIYKLIGNWYFFIITLFFSLSIAFFINRYTPSVYSVSSSILIRDKDNSVIGTIDNILDELGFFRRNRKKTVENEVGILQSYDLIYKTIKKLDFEVSYFSIGRINSPERYQSCPFTVEIDTSFLQKTSQRVFITILSEKKYRLEIEGYPNYNKVLYFGEEFKNDIFSFTIQKNANFEKNYIDKQESSNKYYFVINNFHTLTKLYKSKLAVELFDKKGTILNLSITGLIPQKEVNFLNKLGEEYIQNGLEEKNMIVRNTIKFIDEQLKGIVDSLKIAETNLLDFRLSNNIIDLGKEGSVIFEKLDKIQNEKAIANIKSQYYKYLQNYIKEKRDFTDIVAPSTMGIDDSQLNSIIKNLIDFYNEKSIYSYSAKENTPGLNLINLKIQNAIATLSETVNNLINSIEISVKDIDSRMKVVENEIRKLPINEQKMLNIQRKFNLSDNIYTYLLEKRAEAGIAYASNISDNKILDVARLETASQISPRKGLNYMIALVIGLLIPLIIIIVLDFFNNKITERKDIENHTKVPILASIGHNNKETELVVHEKPKSSISESFRTLRTNLQYMLHEKHNYIISISSTVSGEGKTFCAINIGSIFAISDKKTLLIGLDLRKPKLHKDLNIPNEIGMSTYLIGKNSLQEIICHTPIENLDVITSGPIPPNPAELIESKKFETFLEEVKEIYEYIIIDTPPIALVTDALLISKYTDANIFVIRQNFSAKSVVKLVNELKENKNFKNFSILINDVKAPNHYGIYGKYGYSYGSYYQYGYGYGSNYGYGYYEEDAEMPKNWSEKIKSIFKLKKG